MFQGRFKVNTKNAQYDLPRDLYIIRKITEKDIIRNSEIALSQLDFPKCQDRWIEVGIIRKRELFGNWSI